MNFRYQNVVAAFFCAVLSFASVAAEAKDMSSRLGVGYRNQFVTDLPGLAVQYYPNSDVAIAGAIGIDTQKDFSRFGLMARIHRIVFHEDNLHFYMGAGAGMISLETAGQNESGFELQGFAGCEFFFSGLENLGFTFETGISVVSLSSNVRFRTFGDSPIRAGMTFYF